jgi:uncharacterized tellurite resistance protein B-like protein
MDSNKNYQLGLLYLIHLLIHADGVVNVNGENALNKIKERENISSDVYEKFLSNVRTKKPKNVYQEGIALINDCDDKEKLEAFVHMYKLSEVDGSVHVKEVRLLLYSIKIASIEFNDVVAAAAVKDY